MASLFKHKSRLEKLQQQYTQLMRKSYRVALTNREESEKLNQKAQNILSEINYLSVQLADK